MHIFHTHSCSTNKEWSTQIVGSKGTVYTVRHQKVAGVYDYTCTCPSFKFRRKCKHIDQADKLRCGWDEFYSDGKAQPKPTANNPDQHSCPNCGSDTFIITRGER